MARKLDWVFNYITRDANVVSVTKLFAFSETSKFSFRVVFELPDGRNQHLFFTGTDELDVYRRIQEQLK